MAVNLSILIVPVVFASILVPSSYSAAWVQKNEALSQSGETQRPDLALAARKKEEGDKPKDPGDEGSEPDPYEFTQEDLDRLVEKNENGDYVVTVPEIFYTGGDEAIQKVLKDKGIETIGQYLPDEENNSRVRIFQLYMECCAADARPLSIPVEFDPAPPAGLVDMEWYKVSGVMAFEERNGNSVPIIKATTMISTPAPDGAFYQP